MNKKKSIVLITVIILGTILLLIAGYMLWKTLYEYQKGETLYGDLLEYIIMPKAESEDKYKIGYEVLSPDWDIVWPEVDFDALKLINPDIVGWLYCEGTVINYPVVQGADNDHYLKHLFDRSINSAGSLFLDAGNASDFSNHNSIIYEHHLHSGTMLSGITNYIKLNYYEEFVASIFAAYKLIKKH